jgi:glycerate-2-kinase
MTEGNDFRRILTVASRAALAAVDPARAVFEELRLKGDVLEAGDMFDPLTLPAKDLAVVALGKAAGTMSRAVHDILGHRIAAGIAVVRDEPGFSVPEFEMVMGAHPNPDARSVEACNKIEAFVDEHRDAGRSFLVLLSGGASALVAAPMEGISLEELRKANAWLLDSGHNIRVINLVRRKITRLGGGGLLEQIGSNPTLTLAVSDVVHGAPEDIGSGPTLPDPATNETVMKVVDQGGWPKPGFPDGVYEFLRKGKDGEIPEKPGRDNPIFQSARFVILRDNLIARKVAQQALVDLGCKEVKDGGVISGEARDFGGRIGHLLKTLTKRKKSLFSDYPAGIVYGGESGVTIEGECGIGGRNMELALAIAVEAGENLPFEYAALSFGTDGSDGLSDAAGAFVDSTTIDRAKAAGLDTTHALEGHDADPFFAKLGDLYNTGPTGTNVADIVLIIIGKSKKD